MIPALLNIIKEKAFRIDISAKLAVFFIPAAICFSTDPAPFPRVFFSLWALWVPLTAWAAAPLVKKLLWKFRSDLRLLIIVSFSLVWALFFGSAKDTFSKWTAEGHGLDDYFSPYYMRRDFTPLATAKAIKQLSAGESVPVYTSFDADPYALGFYWSLLKMPDNLFLFDGPKQRILSLKGQFSQKTFIVVREAGELDQLLKRFSCKGLRPVDSSRYQKIYEVTPE